MFTPDYVPNETLFNRSIYFHNMREDMLKLICDETLGSNSLQGLAARYILQARKDFGYLGQKDLDEIYAESVSMLHGEAKTLLKKLSYSFEDLLAVA